MWAHYARNHTGVVVKFNTAKLSKFLKKVDYKPNFPTDREWNLANKKRWGIPFLMYTRKSEDWKYEKEWRLVCPISMLKERKLSYPTDMIASVYFGAKMSPERKKSVAGVIRTHGFDDVALFEMNLSPTEFRLIDSPF